jgi:ribosomal protein S18 acetylase RimI-like enzyme
MLGGRSIRHDSGDYRVMTDNAPAVPELHDLDAWRALSAQNLALLWEHIPRAVGQHTERWNGIWAADANSPFPFPNSATALRPLDDATAADTVARLDAFYAQGCGAPWMLWSAWPTPDLAPFGMQLAGYPPLMVRLPGALEIATDLRTIEATDDEALRDFDKTMINGYPLDELRYPADSLSDSRALGGPMHFFVGYEGTEPVSCAASYVGEREVGVYMVATLPEKRGRGYGAALTATAVNSAPHLPAVLQASDFGQPVYRRLGFEQPGEFTLWFKPRVATS